MKKGLTIIETLVALTIGGIIFSCIYFMVSGSDFSPAEMFMPQQSKAKYQREILEELRRANNLKENE